MDYKITGKRLDRDGDVTHVKVSSLGLLPISRVIDYIEDSGFNFYVVRGGKKAFVEVVVRGGEKYLRTKGDHTELNNLEELPDV